MRGPLSAVEVIVAHLAVDDRGKAPPDGSRSASISPIASLAAAGQLVRTQGAWAVSWQRTP
jgi:hypothetical protein